MMHIEFSLQNPMQSTAILVDVARDIVNNQPADAPAIDLTDVRRTINGSLLAITLPYASGDLSQQEEQTFIDAVTSRVAGVTHVETRYE